MIAVTGASGFLGAAVVRRLAGESAGVVAVSRTPPPDPLPSGVRWIQADLRTLTSSSWPAAVDARLDAVVHLAAFTPKTAADRDRVDEVLASNIAGTRTLLESLPEPPRRLVFSSTLDVYAPEAFAHPVTERSALGPDGLYGASKLFGEALVAAFARASGAEHVTLRLGHIYGPGEDRYAKLVPETIRRVLRGDAPRLAGDGSARRDLLYVDDAAEAIARATAVPLDGVTTINVAAGASHAIADVVRAIVEELDYRGTWERIPEAVPGRSIEFDTRLLRRVLGTWPSTPLATGLRREIDWFRAAA